MNRIFTASLATASVAAGTYSILIWRSVFDIDTRKISSSANVPQTLQKTKSASIINPYDHQTVGSSRSITVQVPKGVNDEVLLSRFVKGFFGGYVFAPEGTILKLLRARLVKLTQLEAEVVPLQTWSISDIHRLKLPPLCSIFFGAFQVLDVHIAIPLASVDGPKRTNSYIDFGWGSTTGGFSGFHRFSVVRDSSEDDETVTIELSDLICNPTVDRPLNLPFLMEFHKVYAMLLFREAVATVLKDG